MANMKMNKWLWLLAAWMVSFLLLKMGLRSAAYGVLLIPVAAFVMFVSKWSNEQKGRASAAAQEFGGNFKYSHLEGASGIAIDPERRLLRLRSGAGTKKPVTQDYPFSDIRDFEKVVLTGGQVVGQHAAGPNMQSAVGASLANVGIAAQNTRINRENRRRSGIFITVKDIEHPKWQVSFPDEMAMDRWMEILRQSLAD